MFGLVRPWSSLFARFLVLLLLVALPWAVGDCGLRDLCGRGQLILRSEE